MPVDGDLNCVLGDNHTPVPLSVSLNNYITLGITLTVLGVLILTP